jgi:alginate O-acetyltransferase complex protein AlgI
LSSWIRDYIYIPLGGSRCSLPRRLINGLIAFALCGLWHGPAWNFVVWGVYHGAGLALCVAYQEIPGLGPRINKLLEKEPLIAPVVTQAYVFIGWLIFFYPLPEALRLAQKLFGLA